MQKRITIALLVLLAVASFVHFPVVQAGLCPDGTTAAACTPATGTDVSTANGGSDAVPPTATITAPADNSAIRGTFSMSVTANDNVGVTSVEFFIDDVTIGYITPAQANGTTYTTSYNTLIPGLAKGPHKVKAVAKDAAGNTGPTNVRTINVDNTASGGSGTGAAAGGTGSGTGGSQPITATDPNCSLDNHNTKICNPLGKTNLTDVVVYVLGKIFEIIGVVAVLMIAFAGFKMVAFASDPKQFDAAKTTISNAAIGLLLAALAYTIVAVIENTLK